MTKVGYIGTGAMGRPMIARLSQRFDVTVYDANRAAADATQATVANSIADLASACDVILSCVPDNATVRAVYLGHGGVVSAIRDHAVTIDCSTVGPDATREVAAGVAAAGGQHLDASMLGSVAQAEAGTISFVVGGDREAFATTKPVLEACGQMIRHVGPSGAGNQMKLVHQTLVAGHSVAVAEAMALCLETGTDIDAFYDIVTGGTGFAYSRYFENRVPRMRERNFDPLFMLRFMLKDARLAREMSTAPEGSYPALEAAIATLAAGDEAGVGDDDFSAAMKVLEQRLGRQLS